MTHVRSLDLWELVCWTYRDQKAHLYLREKANWFDWAIYETTERGTLDVNVSVSYDAAMVHAAVIEIMEKNFMAGILIVQQAISSERPEINGALPRPFPMAPDDGRLRNEDRPSWHLIGGRRIRSVIRCEEKIEVIEQFVRRGKFKGSRAAVQERVKLEPVEYCPLEWSPSPEFTDMVNSIYREWTEAMILLRLKLLDQRLKNHIITGFDFEPAPSFQEPDFAAGAREPDIAARIQPLQGFAEGVSWVEAEDDDNLVPVPWRYRKVVRATLFRQACAA